MKISKKDYSKKKFDVIVVAGQSNAEGNGLGKSQRNYVGKGYQLVDVVPVSPKTDVTPDAKGTDAVNISLPTKLKIEPYSLRLCDDKITRGALGDSFSELYVPENGREVLVIKAFVGGTGFAREEWGLGNVLYERLVLMTDYALSLNPENKIVALLWHQGEHDAFENASFSEGERYDFYFDKFCSQMSDYRKRYSDFKFPIITGEFCNEWAEKPENLEKCNTVERAIKDVCATLGYSAMVSSEGLLSNNQDNGNGDDIHFCWDSSWELGERYFDAFKVLKKEK